MDGARIVGVSAEEFLEYFATTSRGLDEVSDFASKRLMLGGVLEERWNLSVTKMLG